MYELPKLLLLIMNFFISSPLDSEDNVYFSLLLGFGIVFGFTYMD